MSPDVIALGELLVEVMRPEVNLPLWEPHPFLGPYPSGAPAIFAAAAARLGASVGFIGAVGEDDFGDCIRRRLQQDGVDTSTIRTHSDYTTGIAFVAYSDDGERHFVFHARHAAAGQLSPTDVEPHHLAPARALHISGSALAISESSRAACYKALHLAHQREGCLVTFDPNLRAEMLGPERLRQVVEPVLTASDYILASRAEAEMLTGEISTEAAAHSLLARGPHTVAIKLGTDGSLVFTADEVWQIPPFPVDEVDPTGAGDCYDAGFVVGLLNGWPLPQVARFANAVGALSVTQRGPMEGAPTLAQVEAFMAKHP